MTTGMVLGKFLPPHLGHTYLCEFAAERVDRLVIVVGTLAREPIPGALRFAWMREIFPQHTVVHLEEELPQTPEEHPEFWRLWEAALRRVLPLPIDLVFASEAYGAPLAGVLGARFVPCDLAREIVPISGTAIRRDPLAAMRYLPGPVRAHFTRRVAVLGPESSGKTTLARSLGGTFVPEYARAYLEARGTEVTPEALLDIARGQVASEAVLARRSDGLLVSDTDPLTTAMWSELFFGAVDPEIERLAEARYDLTLLLEPDVPYVPDPVRYFPERRREAFERLKDRLTRAGREFEVIGGDFPSREARARERVAHILRR